MEATSNSLSSTEFSNLHDLEDLARPPRTKDSLLPERAESITVQAPHSKHEPPKTNLVPKGRLYIQVHTQNYSSNYYRCILPFKVEKHFGGEH